MPEYTKAVRVSLKAHPELTEAWVSDRITEDPSVLGLGDLEVRHVEHRQPTGGRLDMVLVEPESDMRYEVELMLGPVDESHIIRTIEYWDVERRRYPQYDHCAVLVAESVTSRFLNVISLLNRSLPLMAIEMAALQAENKLTLWFTRVVDTMPLGPDETEAEPPSADRAYWEGLGSKESVAAVDACLALLKEISPRLDLNFNRHYIGLTEAGRPKNFITFKAKKHFAVAAARVADYEAWRATLEEAGIDVLEGGRPGGRVAFRLDAACVAAQRSVLADLFRASFDNWG